MVRGVEIPATFRTYGIEHRRQSAQLGERGRVFPPSSDFGPGNREAAPAARWKRSEVDSASERIGNTLNACRQRIRQHINQPLDASRGGILPKADAIKTMVYGTRTGNAEDDRAEGPGVNYK